MGALDASGGNEEEEEDATEEIVFDNTSDTGSAAALHALEQTSLGATSRVTAISICFYQVRRRHRNR